MFFLGCTLNETGLILVTRSLEGRAIAIKRLYIEEGKEGEMENNVGFMISDLR